MDLANSSYRLHPLSIHAIDVRIKVNVGRKCKAINCQKQFPGVKFGSLKNQGFSQDVQ